jgi:hypothetical protein
MIFEITEITTWQGRLYEHATCVLVWLGCGNEDVVPVLDYLRRIGEILLKYDRTLLGGDLAGAQVESFALEYPSRS